MTTSFLLVCCKSCLKSGSASAYYEILGVEPRCDAESIKRAYKKMSLALHPDKIAQRGGSVTDEDKAMLLKVKEAYTVLVDPKRRKLYDQLGETGLKLVEDPSELMKAESQVAIISNFQKNTKDRYKLFLIVMLIFCSIVIFPILFALKCDGYIPSVKWAALWTPLWLLDCLLLITAVMAFHIVEETEDSEGNITKQVPTAAENAEKAANLVLNVTFVLLQLFLVLRMDRVIDWSWFEVFIPWFIHDVLSAGMYLAVALQTLPPAPTATEPEPDAESDEDPMHATMKYYEAILLRRDARSRVVFNLLRVWFAGFLAYKLNVITEVTALPDWNWGFVLLPVWVHIAYFYLNATKGYRESTVIAAELESKGDEETRSPADQGKDLYGQSLSSTFSSTCCCIGPAFILISVLLVCSLEVTPISTFIIILPVFIVFAILLLCILGVWCCLSTVDTDALGATEEEAMEAGVSSPIVEGESPSLTVPLLQTTSSPVLIVVDSPPKPAAPEVEVVMVEKVGVEVAKEAGVDID